MSAVDVLKVLDDDRKVLVAADSISAMPLVLTEHDEARAAVAEAIAALRTVQMLRQLGGLMPGSREVVMVAVDAADAALAKCHGDQP